MLTTHRLLEEGGWRTRKRNDGTTEWIPPQHMDTGQPRVTDHWPRYVLAQDQHKDGANASTIQE
jgi:hypothetical protein